MNITAEKGFTKKLTRVGFVFLDLRNQPYRCCMWEGSPWLFFWHPDNRWVSLRKVTQMEVWSFPHNISKRDQKAYKIAEHDSYKTHPVCLQSKQTASQPPEKHEEKASTSLGGEQESQEVHQE